jgi:hypothetical protein
MRWVWLCVVLAACDLPPEIKVAQACSAVCHCTEAPGQVEACTAQCEQDPDVINLTDECFDCIAANADQCSILEQTCEPICEPPRPTPNVDGGLSP